MTPDDQPGSWAELPSWRRYLRFWGLSVRADVDDEIAHHLELTVRDLVARGVAERDAREEAERRFGSLREIRSECLTIDERRHRTAGRRERILIVRRELRYAFRALRRSPGFTLMTILCLALGIGVTTTIFSAVNGILLRPLPYPRAQELVAIYARLPKNNATGINISWPDFVSWRDASRTFARMGIWTWSTYTISGRGGAERVEGADVSADLLASLGVKPQLGRLFVAAEDQRGAARVAILSDALWRRRFGGDMAIVGRMIDINGSAATVVGVMPPVFNFPERGQLWMPFSAALPQWGEGRDNRGFAGAIGRLKPGITFEQAAADLQTISLKLQHDHPVDNFGWEADPLPLREDLVGSLRRPVLVFLGAVALVLLIACANVANLLLVRGAARQREMAVRLAIGGGRGTVVRQFLTEALMLALAGGALGVALSRAGVRLLVLAFPNDVPFYLSFGVDHSVLLFALVVSVASGILFGVLPALRASQLDPGGALREGGRSASIGHEKSRLRGGLVVAEIALTLVVTIGAMLLMRSLQGLQSTDLGFRPRGLLTMRIALPGAKYSTGSERQQYYTNLFDRLRALPGVESVGSGNGIPFSGWNVQAYVSIEGRPPARQGEEFDVHYQNVSPDFFRSLGVPLVHGRRLRATDRDTANVVVLVNERFARQQFPGADPIGHRVRIGDERSNDPWATIVGVVADYRHYRLPEEMHPAMYFPLFAYPSAQQDVVIRTTLRDPLALVPAVRNALRDLDPDVPAFRVQSMDQAVARSLWRQRFQSNVLTVFSLLALVLAAVGIYGVLSFTVVQRTREIGVRMALGATRRTVLGLVMRRAVRLATLGLVIGVVGALAVTRVLAQLLYEISPTDAVTFVSAPLVIGAVAIMASWLPAWRAARIDPGMAMRSE